MHWITKNEDKIKNWLDSSEAAPINDDPNFSSSYAVQSPGSHFIKEVFYNHNGVDNDIKSGNFENYTQGELAHLVKINSDLPIEYEYDDG